MVEEATVAEDQEDEVYYQGTVSVLLDVVLKLCDLVVSDAEEEDDVHDVALLVVLQL